MPSDRYPHVTERNKRICALYEEGRASGLSLTALGKEFDLSRETIRGIIRRRNNARRRAEALAPLREAFAKGNGDPRRHDRT
ncbi:hypothetical protein ACNJX9_11265 [Bradyrhizobium sp. DASA03076]|uniref:hypothetical protein n=1 Tax=Bradyrhizobium sp. BLXBL-03 TaxID=3395916 RepID=UPI003F6F8CA0